MSALVYRWQAFILNYLRGFLCSDVAIMIVRLWRAFTTKSLCDHIIDNSYTRIHKNYTETRIVLYPNPQTHGGIPRGYIRAHVFAAMIRYLNHNIAAMIIQLWNQIRAPYIMTIEHYASGTYVIYDHMLFKVNCGTDMTAYTWTYHTAVPCNSVATTNWNTVLKICDFNEFVVQVRGYFILTDSSLYTIVNSPTINQDSIMIGEYRNSDKVTICRLINSFGDINKCIKLMNSNSEYIDNISGIVNIIKRKRGGIYVVTERTKNSYIFKRNEKYGDYRAYVMRNVQAVCDWPSYERGNVKQNHSSYLCINNMRIFIKKQNVPVSFGCCEYTVDMRICRYCYKTKYCPRYSWPTSDKCDNELNICIAGFRSYDHQCLHRVTSAT